MNTVIICKLLFGKQHSRDFDDEKVYEIINYAENANARYYNSGIHAHKDDFVEKALDLLTYFLQKKNSHKQSIKTCSIQFVANAEKCEQLLTKTNFLNHYPQINYRYYELNYKEVLVIGETLNVDFLIQKSDEMFEPVAKNNI